MSKQKYSLIMRDPKDGEYSWHWPWKLLLSGVECADAESAGKTVQGRNRPWIVTDAEADNVVGDYVQPVGVEVTE